MTPPRRSSRGPNRGWIKDTVQIAGIVDELEARMLVDSGVDLLGIPLGAPVHNENLTERDVARIAGDPACRGRVVLITYLDKAGDILLLCRNLEIGIVQLHGEIKSDEIARLRSMDPELRIVKSLVIGQSDIASQMEATGGLVDAFITDTFDEKTGARGATGMTHDWRKSRAIVQRSLLPVMLAGGLNHRNVARAIREVGPAGVDVHTGVEDARDRKVPELVRAFVAQARAAFAARRKTK